MPIRERLEEASIEVNAKRGSSAAANLNSEKDLENFFANRKQFNTEVETIRIAGSKITESIKTAINTLLNGLSALEIGASGWTMVVFGAVIGFTIAALSGIGTAAVAAVLFLTGNKGLQQTKKESERLNRENQELLGILCSDEGIKPADTKQARALKVLTSKKVESTTASKAAAIASGVTTAITMLALAAAPLWFMAVLPFFWVIVPLAAVFGVVILAFSKYKSWKNKKLQKITTDLEDERRALLNELGNFQSTSRELSPEDEHFLSVSRKDKLPVLGVSLVFGGISAAVIYAAGITVVSFIFPPFALVLLAVGIAAAGYRFIKKDVQASVDECQNKISRMCGQIVKGKPSASLSASTKIEVISVVLAVVALVTVPIIGWVVAAAFSLVCGVACYYCTKRISENDAARANVVEKVEEKIKNERLDQLDKMQPEVRRSTSLEVAEQFGSKSERSISESPSVTASKHPRVSSNLFRPIPPDTKLSESKEEGGRESEGTGDGDGSKTPPL